jgi:GH43 family beta-xylosidase
VDGRVRRGHIRGRRPQAVPICARTIDGRNLRDAVEARRTEPLRGCAEASLRFPPEHRWERWGEHNEYLHEAWIEGPWMFKRNGKYYLEYSGSGTQWVSYATGVYMARSPLGPFTYAAGNPVLRKTTGIVTGPGHGCVVQGPDGKWWQFYTIVYSNPPGGRRVGMEPVAFDGNVGT